MFYHKGTTPQRNAGQAETKKSILSSAFLIYAVMDLVIVLILAAITVMRISGV